MDMVSRMTFVEDLTYGLQDMVGPGRRFKNPNQLAEYLGMSATQVTRYIKGERTKNLGVIGEILDRLGFRLLRPGEKQVVINEDEIRRRVAQEVFDACNEARLDGETMARITAAARGIPYAGGDGQSNHRIRSAAG